MDWLKQLKEIKEAKDLDDEITEIEHIIAPFRQGQGLDRQKAFDKINDLRSKDLKNRAITTLVTTPNAPRVTESSNQVLVNELCFWENVLIVKKGLEEKDEEKRKQFFNKYGLTEEIVSAVLSIIKPME